MPKTVPRDRSRTAARQLNCSVNQDRLVPAAQDQTPPVIFLVDDDPSVRESLRRVFAQAGLHVVTADSGEQALEQLEVLQPNLVVTDLCMDAVSGWDLVFHHHLHDAGLPFIVITALPLQDAGGVEALAAGFFQKPLNLDALIEAIHACLTVPRLASSEDADLPLS